MRWEDQRQSDHIEDRRDDDGGGGRRTGGGLPLGGGRLGLGGIVLALAASWLLGINPLTVLGLLGGAEPAAVSAPQAPATPRPVAKDPTTQFVRAVLASTEDVWSERFAASNARYELPTLVLFRGSTPTACGTGQSAMGPFYCPGDRKVYIDLAFYDTLKRQLGAPGDFAQAYVIAHEVGHHVQNLMGLTDKVERLRQRQSRAEANATSVRLELQADCFSGVWAFHSQARQRWLDQGDIDEALNAAAHIGDDALQQSAGGVVRPESFTHGSSEQRVRWFKRGLANGRVQDCNTFDTRAL